MPRGPAGMRPRLGPFVFRDCVARCLVLEVCWTFVLPDPLKFSKTCCPQAEFPSGRVPDDAR